MNRRRGLSWGVVLFLAGMTAACRSQPLAAPAPPHVEPGIKGNWSYEGRTGPANWARLLPYYVCADGREQSPIDVRGAQPGTDLPALDVRGYRETGVAVLNNGHTVEVEVDEGSVLEVGGEHFDLAQFHFHAPSEHQIDGRAAAMEMHLVHRSESGQLLVIGLLLREGATNAFLDLFWRFIPPEPNETPTDVHLNPRDALPADRSYHRYDGSLTTLPCSEPVAWYVLRDAVTVSPAQVAKFLEIIGQNARPPQPLNGRVVQTGPSPR